MIREYEAGARAQVVCRQYGVGDAPFYKRRSTYGGMEVSDAKRRRGLEEENARLKRLPAAMLDDAALKDLATKYCRFGMSPPSVRSPCRACEAARRRRCHGPAWAE